MKIAHGSLPERLSKFLFNYHLTPQSTTGLSPAELLCGRKLKTRLDLLKPNLGNRMRLKIADQGRYQNTHSKHRSFQSGDLVYDKGFGGYDSWIPGVILCQTGSVSYKVQLEEREMIWRWHVDHLIKRFLPNAERVDHPCLQEKKPNPLDKQQIEAESSQTCERASSQTPRYHVREQSLPNRLTY